MHATSDIDVRKAPGRAQQIAVLSRQSRLARPLLLFTLASMSACVVPVAPSFQDPPPTLEAPPYIASSDPEINSAVTVLPGGSANFAVELTDVTPNATIYYTWALDYPPYDPVNTRSGGPTIPVGPSVDGRPTDGTVSFTLNCSTVVPSPGTGPQHMFSLLVADRSFSTMPGRFGQIDDQTGHLLSAAIWFVNYSCQATGTSGTGAP